jgi:hypothetical protein
MEGIRVHDLVLKGLNGSNPLAFLAALGALEGAGGATGSVRLAWHYDGEWHPVLTCDAADLDELVDQLDRDRRACVFDPALSLTYHHKRDLKPPPGVFRDYLKNLLDGTTSADRRSVDWASAFATDVAVDRKGNTKPTALHFTAGQQEFLQMVGDLVTQVTRDDLREAIEGPWRYERLLPVLAWDATASRDYALRATDPSTDKKRGVPGADWLALRGLTYLPAVPQGARVATTGCRGGWKDGKFRWPLWTVPLTGAVIRSVLRQATDEMPATERAARGIGIVLCSGIKRSDQGGYGSFTPASVV